MRCKEKAPYFVLDDQQNLLFAPYGKYGASYYVPNNSVRERIMKRYGVITALNMMPMMLKSVVGLVLIHYRQHGYVEASAILIGMALAWTVSARLIRKEVANLLLARPEPSFYQNCLTLSDSTSVLALWLWQAGATAWAIACYSFMRWLHISRGVDFAILCALIAISPITVAFCSYLLHLKNRPIRIRV